MKFEQRRRTSRKKLDSRSLAYLASPKFGVTKTAPISVLKNELLSLRYDPSNGAPYLGFVIRQYVFLPTKKTERRWRWSSGNILRLRLFYNETKNAHRWRIRPIKKNVSINWTFLPKGRPRRPVAHRSLPAFDDFASMIPFSILVIRITVKNTLFFSFFSGFFDASFCWGFPDSHSYRGILS